MRSSLDQAQRFRRTAITTVGAGTTVGVGGEGRGVVYNEMDLSHLRCGIGTSVFHKLVLNMTKVLTLQARVQAEVARMSACEYMYRERL